MFATTVLARGIRYDIAIVPKDDLGTLLGPGLDVRAGKGGRPGKSATAGTAARPSRSRCHPRATRRRSRSVSRSETGSSRGRWWTWSRAGARAAAPAEARHRYERDRLSRPALARLHRHPAPHSCLANDRSLYGASPSEAANTHGLDVHIIGAGNSAGQASSSAPMPRPRAPSRDRTRPEGLRAHGRTRAARDAEASSADRTSSKQAPPASPPAATSDTAP